VPTGKRRLVAWFIRQELARSMAVSPKIPFRPCLMRAGSRREGWRRSRVSGEDNPSIPTASSWSRADPVGWHYRRRRLSFFDCLWSAYSVLLCRRRTTISSPNNSASAAQITRITPEVINTSFLDSLSSRYMFSMSGIKSRIK